MGLLISFNLFFLFITSFLAGSFIPLGSEVHLLALHGQGFTTWPLLLVASFGNTVGGMTCYFIAAYGGKKFIKKYLKVDEVKLEGWVKKLENKNEWSALFCWLPFVGELIAASLGLLSKRFILIFILMFIGKLGRYYVVLKGFIFLI